MSEASFSRQDLAQLEEIGLNPGQIQKQLGLFHSGVPYAKLVRPCMLDDGIASISESEYGGLMDRFEKARSLGRFAKFVPASGAATRMFQPLFAALEQVKKGRGPDSPDLKKFLAGIRRFAFYPELRKRLAERGRNLDELAANGNAQPILHTLLDRDEMGYGQLPKGLLAFHTYGEVSRTPVEEHFREAERYVRDREGAARLHFTVSPEHLADFRAFAELARRRYEHRDFKLILSFSTQKASTDTIAVDLENRPFRDAGDRLVFRPAGHGALIENLNDLNADLIFIKNIDNVVPERLLETTVTYKKLLAGMLLRLQETVFSLLRKLAGRKFSQEDRDEVCQLLSRLGVRPGSTLRDMEPERAGRVLCGLLNRPMRVCGMVRNLGEPGGGPFWTQSELGESLQIVESSQIDAANPDQAAKLAASTHFNPVDLVCGLRDYRGEQFDLHRYVDDRACFISNKSKDGRPLRALERPGLWNGAMAHWHTVFVEVPALTFNPVKTVNDLLRPEHSEDFGSGL